MSTPKADVALILEGSYPYVSGGVSSWVHELLLAHSNRKFALIHVSPRCDFYNRRVFDLPDNVVELQEVYCRGTEKPATWRRPAQIRQTHGTSRVIAAIRRIHLEDRVDSQLVSDLCAKDLSVHQFLYGDESFALLHDDLYPKVGEGMSFADFFWHFRALHVPMLRLLNTDFAHAGVYHAVAAGYAGLVGTVASVQTGSQFLITEHGIYAREREIELSRASWISDDAPSARLTARPSPLRKFWSHFFKMLSRIAYHRARRVVTLSESNRRQQLANGADPTKTHIVPNGVDPSKYAQPSSKGRRDGGRFRIGFVGRVVPIKDVLTLLRAYDIAHRRVDMELWIVGPEDEDPDYAQRCHVLAQDMRIDDHVHFLGRQPMAQVYPKLDAVVLTSISEGQPLVILEAYANGVPVIATDVGACRELVEGSDAADRRLGPSGIITRVVNPLETALAMIFMAEDGPARLAMGRVGLARVASRYQQSQVVARYDRLYTSLGSPWLA